MEMETIVKNDNIQGHTFRKQQWTSPSIGGTIKGKGKKERVDEIRFIKRDFILPSEVKQLANDVNFWMILEEKKELANLLPKDKKLWVTTSPNVSKAPFYNGVSLAELPQRVSVESGKKGKKKSTGYGGRPLNQSNPIILMRVYNARERSSRILRRQYFPCPLTIQKISFGLAQCLFHKDPPDCQGGCEIGFAATIWNRLVRLQRRFWESGWNALAHQTIINWLALQLRFWMDVMLFRNWSLCRTPSTIFL